MTIADDIQTIPNLRGRAKSAYEDAAAAAKAKDREIYDDMHDRFCAFAFEVLKVEQGTWACATIREARYTIAKGTRHPSEPSVDQCLLVALDGVNFRVRLKTEVLHRIGTANKDIYTEITDVDLVVEYKASSATHVPIKDLAELGDAMRMHP